jgi:hypothetical protein
MLESVSPTRLERLRRCPLRIAFEQAAPEVARVATSATALCGLAAHRTIELVIGSSWDLKAAWATACDELSAQGAGDVQSTYSARRTLLRLERRLNELLGYRDQHTPKTVRVEQTLVSRDRTVSGRLDLLLVGPEVAVVDYKTGTVTDAGAVRESYERQLAVYAWLAAEHLGVDEVEGALFSLREGIVTVDVTASVRNTVVATLLSLRAAFNSRVPGPQPATPCEASCGWCPFVCSCEPAWTSLDEGVITTLGRGDAVSGVVSAEAVMAASGTSAIRLQIDRGTVRGEAVIADVSHHVAGALHAGDRATFVGLARRSEQPLTFAWRDEISQGMKGAA